MTDKAITRHSPVADRDAMAKRVLEECLASAIEEGGDGMVAAIDLNIDQFNEFMCKSADGRNGAPLDEYSRGAPLPTPEDERYRDAVDRWVALHPGTSTSEALGHVMYMLGHDQKEAA